MSAPSSPISKSQSRPTPAKLRHVLRACLNAPSMSPVLVGQMLVAIARRDVRYDATCFQLMARCLRKLSAMDLARIFHDCEKEALQRDGVHPPASPPASVEQPQTPPAVPDAADDASRSEHQHDNADYLADLNAIVADCDGAYAVLLDPAVSRPRFSAYMDNMNSTLHVNVSVHLSFSGAHMHAHFAETLTGDGCTKYSQTEDTDEGSAAFQRAANIASKPICSTLHKMAERVLSEAKLMLSNALSSKFEMWKAPHYVEKSRLTYQRAKAMVTNDKFAGLYGVKVFLYGSATTGMMLGDSDIDVALKLPSSDGVDDSLRNDPQGQKRTDVLKYLQKYAKKAGMEAIWVLESAKVPVLRYWDPVSRMNVDVTIISDTSILLCRLLRKHLMSDSRVWELAMMVKYWAKRRKISGTPEGFINPMGWTIMAIFFLQHIASPRIGSLFRVKKGTNKNYESIVKVPWASCQKLGFSRESTSDLLIKFFDFFANSFEFDKTAISLGTQHMTQFSNTGGHSAPIFIEQPLIRGVNVVSYISASSVELTKIELRRACDVCRTVGKLDELCRTRYTEEERLFTRE